MADRIAMVITATPHLPPGEYRVGDALVRAHAGPLRRAEFPALFRGADSPLEGPAAGGGSLEERGGRAVETLDAGEHWWALALLSLARAEHPGLVWRSRPCPGASDPRAHLAVGVLGREVVALVASVSD